jgi:hypothetical protein
LSSVKDIQLFGILKKDIVDIMKKSHPGIPENISSWRGQEIIDFQEELMLTVHEARSGFTCI